MFLEYLGFLFRKLRLFFSFDVVYNFFKNKVVNIKIGHKKQ